MKKIKLYFCGGCIAFTVIIMISSIIHIINQQDTFRVTSQLQLFFIVLLVQTVLYFMENIQVKSQILHVLLELLLIITITFIIGTPMKVIKITSLQDAMEILLIIAISYGTALLCLYKTSSDDADSINEKLIRK